MSEDVLNCLVHVEFCQGHSNELMHNGVQGKRKHRQVFVPGFVLFSNVGGNYGFETSVYVYSEVGLWMIH